jgi:tetratricopeptide (TPR) repeat protein
MTVAGFAATSYHSERDKLGARHFRSGAWSLDHGNLDDAVDQFRKALLFSPDEEQYRLALADSLVREGHLTEAESHLDQLADEDPSNGRINSLLAQIAEKHGDRKLAIERFQRAVYEYWPPNQIPLRHEARWQLVHLLAAADRSNEAVGELIQLYSSTPDAPGRTRIAFELLKFGAVSEAERIFHDQESTSPNTALPHRGLGMVDFDKGDFISARHEFQHAHHIDNNDQESVQWLTLTNSVIDLDPLLPGISTKERRRRSQNLLSGVVHFVTACSPGVANNANAASELDAANDLLTSTPKGEDIADIADTMQQLAVQLWRDRGLFCGGSLAGDKAIDTAIARVTGE